MLEIFVWVISIGLGMFVGELIRDKLAWVAVPLMMLSSVVLLMSGYGTLIGSLVGSLFGHWVTWFVIDRAESRRAAVEGKPDAVDEFCELLAGWGVDAGIRADLLVRYGIRGSIRDELVSRVNVGEDFYTVIEDASWLGGVSVRDKFEEAFGLDSLAVEFALGRLVAGAEVSSGLDESGSLVLSVDGEVVR